MSVQTDTWKVTIQDTQKKVARVCNHPSHSMPCTGFVGDEFLFIFLPLTHDNNTERQTQTKSYVASYVIMTSSCTTFNLIESLFL